jgi:hypothetical protein
MKKSKSIFALSFAGATLASAIAFAGPAGAFNFVYDNVTYDVNTYTGSFNDLQSTLTSSDNALWGNPSLAEGLAGVVKGDLGYPNGIGLLMGPYFASSIVYFPNDSLVYGSVFCGKGCFIGSGSTLSVPFLGELQQTYATATAVPEPLTIFGSITATGFLAAFNRIKNKKKE